MAMYYFSSEESVHRIGRGLMDLSLPKAEWTHAAHFAAALWFLRFRRCADPVAEMRQLIRTYNEATGVPNTDTDGYHETITVASLRAARATLSSYSLSIPIHAIVNELLTSPLGRSDWLLSYWSKNLLFSSKARREWVAPDLRPLPF